MKILRITSMNPAGKLLAEVYVPDDFKPEHLKFEIAGVPEGATGFLRPKLQFTEFATGGK